MDLVDSQRQQHLPRAARSTEADEDETDSFLQAQVGIEKPRPISRYGTAIQAHIWVTRRAAPWREPHRSCDA